MSDAMTPEAARANIRLDLTMCGPEDLDAYAAAIRRATLAEARQVVRMALNAELTPNISDASQGAFVRWGRIEGLKKSIAALDALER